MYCLSCWMELKLQKYGLRLCILARWPWCIYCYSYCYDFSPGIRWWGQHSCYWWLHTAHLPSWARWQRGLREWRFCNRLCSWGAQWWVIQAKEKNPNNPQMTLNTKPDERCYACASQRIDSEMNNLSCNVNVDFSGEGYSLFLLFTTREFLFVSLVLFFVHVSSVSGRSSAYGDTTVEGHPAGPGSVSSSTGAISTTTAQQEGEGSEGEGETEGDIHTSNRSDRINTL